MPKTKSAPSIDQLSGEDLEVALFGAVGWTDIWRRPSRGMMGHHPDGSYCRLSRTSSSVDDVLGYPMWRVQALDANARWVLDVVQRGVSLATLHFRGGVYEAAGSLPATALSRAILKGLTAEAPGA